MERKKIRSECEFMDLKNNRLKYKYKKFHDTSAKSVDDLKKIFQEHINFVMVMLINLFCY